MDKVEKIEQGLITKAKIERRVKANRIIGRIVFRNHYSSHPGRHSWDLCGHPVYWWTFKAAMDCKYLEKITVWTEVEEALETAKKMSDKFVTIKRSIEECKEPTWIIIDDLKTSTSRIPMEYTITPEIINEKLGFQPTLQVNCSVCHPLETTESLNRLVEKYFEDDMAERVYLVYKAELGYVTIDPNNPQYVLPVGEFENLGRRQQCPPLYKVSGSRIVSYEWLRMQRIAMVEISKEEGIDIHDEKDLKKARFFMRDRLEKECKWQES